MNVLLLVLMTLALMAATPAWSAPRTITLSVPTMDCAACPITVKKSLTRVAGVSKAEVNFDKRQAIVTFDDALVSVETLTQATRNAGYASTVAGAPK